MRVDSLEELVMMHMGPPYYNDILFSSLYDYQMGACVSPISYVPCSWRQI